MNDGVRLECANHPADCGGIDDVDLLELEFVVLIRGEAQRAAAQIVDDAYGMLVEEQPHGLAANEAVATGNQYSSAHADSLAPLCLCPNQMKLSADQLSGAKRLSYLLR